MAKDHPAPSAIASGALLGDRYRLEHPIATGGMATVWLATDQELERPVAVKILSDVLAQDPSYVARFRREAKVAAGLSHPNLVRIFDFGGEGERPYLVMEYIPGPTLAERIAAGGSDLDGERLAQDLLGALAHIHDAGVVHRDVKPSNILLEPDGRPRLTDFGIAQPEDATRMTQTGQVIGTLRYLAPEVIEGKRATERSDLYSAGVVLREAARGRGASLANLLDRLTAPDPARRPASARDAVAMLPGPARPGPVTARTKVLPAGARQIEVTPLRALAALAAVGLGILVVILALGGGGHPAATSHQTTPRPPSSTQTTTTTTTTTTSPAAPPPAAPPPAAPPPAAKKPKPPKPPPEPKKK